MDSLDNNLRMFIAIPIPSEIVEGMMKIISCLRSSYFPGARWSRSDQMHITVKFLGDTPPDAITPISDFLKRFAKDKYSYPLRFDTLGAFPNRTLPRVVWAGTTNIPECHMKRVKEIDIGLHQFGFPLESKPVIPHLTLARIRNPVRIPWPTKQEVVKLFDNIPDFYVNSIQLLSSSLSVSGARYRLLQEVRLLKL